ncbi:2'-5' RNA ligase family protein [Qipengyuania sp. 1NDH10]|nr:2'-5' RNA ligase family protein [Qipengyuania vesicularis]MBX7526488.1 2'-5' RNA ligase family protein [Qipengyuania vesicularis]
MHRRYTDLRTQFFPPERNYLEAHVTLFHAIPAQCEDELRRYLARLTGEVPPIRGQVEGLMSLGGGTAIKLSSPDLLALRDEIAEHLRGMLTQQDQHRPRLHVTIQNKVTSKDAKALQAQLAGTIEPREFAFSGLALYIYRGGPWEFVRRFAFRGK